MKSLVTSYKLIREGKSWHEIPFLEPIDRTERTRKKNSLNCSESNQSLMKRIAHVNVFQGPVGLFCYNRDIFNSIEEVLLLELIFNVGLDEQRISLRMDILHSNLKAVEGSCLRSRHLQAELLSQVLYHYSITRCKKCQHVLYEVLLVLVQFLPVEQVGLQVYFLSRPETSLMFFVHVVNVLVLDRKEDEPLFGLFQQGLLSQTSFGRRVGLRVKVKSISQTVHFIIKEIQFQIQKKTSQSKCRDQNCFISINWIFLGHFISLKLYWSADRTNQASAWFMHMGGCARRIVPQGPPLPMSTPFYLNFSNILLVVQRSGVLDSLSLTNSMAIIIPLPLTSPMYLVFSPSFFMFSMRYPPTFSAFEGRLSSSMIFSTYIPTRHWIGPAEKVLKNSFPEMESAISFEVITAPRGIPFPIPLAIVIMSGCASLSKQPQYLVPILPNPVCTQSAMQIPLCFLTISQTFFRYPSGIGTIPPAPIMGQLSHPAIEPDVVDSINQATSLAQNCPGSGPLQLHRYAPGQEAFQIANPFSRP